MADLSTRDLLQVVLTDMSARISGQSPPEGVLPEQVDPVTEDPMQPGTEADPAAVQEQAQPEPVAQAPVPTGKGRLGPDEIAVLALAAGFDPEAAVIAVAVAMGESGGNPGATGDTTLQTSKWGPSVGLMQVRSLNAEKGTGKLRDEQANYDPLTNMRAAVSISNGGKNWKPWTVYTKGIYKRHLTAARAAVERAQRQRGPGRAI